VLKSEISEGAGASAGLVRVVPFQFGKNTPTPPVFSQEWQIKEISRGNVPVWRYDQGGRLPEPEE
jgi:hypothetical protein